MKTPITDPVLIEECIRKLADYGYDNEVKHFEEQFSDYEPFDSQWSTEDCIEHIESIPGGTDHILYSMLVLRSYLSFCDKHLTFDEE